MKLYDFGFSLFSFVSLSLVRITIASISKYLRDARFAPNSFRARNDTQRITIQAIRQLLRRRIISRANIDFIAHFPFRRFFHSDISKTIAISQRRRFCRTSERKLDFIRRASNDRTYPIPSYRSNSILKRYLDRIYVEYRAIYR